MRDYCGSLERLDKIAGIIDGVKLRYVVAPGRLMHEVITNEEIEEIYKLASGKKL